MHTPTTITDTSVAHSTPVPSPSIAPGTRVLCLYRVSSDKQLYYDDEQKVDIPMQRIRCREYAAAQDWNIVYELQEEGISGYKAVEQAKSQAAIISQQFDELIDWVRKYPSASHDAKRIILYHIIERVDIFRGYRLNMQLTE